MAVLKHVDVELVSPAFATSRRGPLIIAHRGAPHEQAENTLPSFRAARDAGADVLELDVRTSADGELVVIHDATVDRTSSSCGRVDHMTYAQLRRCVLHEPTTAPQWRAATDAPPYIPRLHEVLQAFPDAAFNIDLKAVSASAASALVDAIGRLRRAGHPSLCVLLTAKSAATQRAIRQRNRNDVLLGMGRNDVIAVLKKAWLNLGSVDALEGLAFQAPAYRRLCGVRVPIFTAPVQRLLAKMKSPAHLWCDDGMVDDIALAEALVARGATGLFTNEPRKLVAHFR